MKVLTIRFGDEDAVALGLTVGEHEGDDFYGVLDKIQKGYKVLDVAMLEVAHTAGIADQLIPDPVANGLFALAHEAGIADQKVNEYLEWFEECADSEAYRKWESPELLLLDLKEYVAQCEENGEHFAE